MAGTIDVTLLPAPTLLDTTYETIRTARLVSLQARFAAVGIDWDVATIEADPGVILQEEDAFRQMLDLAAINDAVKRVLAAYARGADLDQLVALNGTARLVVTPADPIAGTAAVMESDGNLLLRYLAGFSAPAAGSRLGYIAQARAAYPGALDVAAYKTVAAGQPYVNVILAAPGGADVPPATIAAVYAAVTADDAAPLTAAINVRAATRTLWSVSAMLAIPDGPSPDAVTAQALAALVALGAARSKIGAFVPANAPPGVLYVPNVLAVTLTQPFTGVAAAPDAMPVLDLTGVTLTPVVAT